MSAWIRIKLPPFVQRRRGAVSDFRPDAGIGTRVIELGLEDTEWMLDLRAHHSDAAVGIVASMRVRREIDLPDQFLSLRTREIPDITHVGGRNLAVTRTRPVLGRRWRVDDCCIDQRARTNRHSAFLKRVMSDSWVPC